MATAPANLTAALTPPAPAAPRTSPIRGLRITFGGLLCACIVILVGLAGLNSEANLLYLLTGISLGILILSAVLPVLIVRGIDVDRTIPEAVVAGRPFQLSYLLRNRRRFFNAWSLVISEQAPDRSSRRSQPHRPFRFPCAFTPLLRPGAECRIDLLSTFSSRGQLSLSGVRVLTRFPLGLFSCHVDFIMPASVMIYPPLGHFRHDPWRDYRAATAASNRTLRHRSGHEEFYGVREYRQGDNLRWIHWRRSARTGELVVREMLPLKPTQLIVLVDPWPEQVRPAAPGEHVRPDARAEVVISAAATALCDALERGYRAGLICRAARPVVLPPVAGRAQRQRILHELACAVPGCPRPLDDIVAQIRWSTGWHARCLLCAATLAEPHEHVVRFLSIRAEALAILSPQKDDFYQLFESQHDPAGERAA